jgi:histidinol-phosphatase (PHP family)
MIDYHLHGNFCGHGCGELEEYVRCALEKEFVEIGFSAHLPKVRDPDPYHAMLEDDLPRYVELVESLRVKYRNDITIKLGIEADYFEGFESDTRRLLESFPFDYVLGSIHFLGDWHFTSREGRGRYKTEDPDAAFPRYFHLLKRMIGSALFDIAAHPDAIRKTGFRPQHSMEGEFREIAACLSKAGMSIEVNTAGIRRGGGAIYPEKAFLEACMHAGVPMTLGSDAHIPDDVGRDYDALYAMLSELDVKEIATYQRRRIVKRSLSDFFGAGKKAR